MEGRNLEDGLMKIRDGAIEYRKELYVFSQEDIDLYNDLVEKYRIKCDENHRVKAKRIVLINLFEVGLGYVKITHPIGEIQYESFTTSGYDEPFMFIHYTPDRFRECVLNNYVDWVYCDYMIRSNNGDY